MSQSPCSLGQVRDNISPGRKTVNLIYQIYVAVLYTVIALIVLAMSVLVVIPLWKTNFVGKQKKKIEKLVRMVRRSFSQF